MENEHLRHFLAALAYRANQALREAPSNFAEFSIGQGVRTPIEIVRHMSRVLSYAVFRLTPGQSEFSREFAKGDWDWEVNRFYNVLESLDLLLTLPLRGTMTWQQLLQGPLADAMTHVGQLATLRRMVGAPVTYENFIEADIEIGKLRPMIRGK